MEINSNQNHLSVYVRVSYLYTCILYVAAAHTDVSEFMTTTEATSKTHTKHKFQSSGLNFGLTMSENVIGHAMCFDY